MKKELSNAATEEVIFSLFEIFVSKFQNFVLTFNKIDCAFKEGEIFKVSVFAIIQDSLQDCS